MSGLEEKTEKQVKNILSKAGDEIEKILRRECIIIVENSNGIAIKYEGKIKGGNDIIMQIDNIPF